MATFQITSPDGGTYEVTAPDNASEDEILSYAQSQFKSQEKPQAETQRALAALQGLTLGWGDEIGAGLAAGAAAVLNDANFSEAYRDIRGDLNKKYDAYQAENPGEALALEIGGGLLTGGVGAAKTAGAQGASALSKIGRSAALGAGYGGAAGAGYADEGERLSGAARGAVTGGVIGGALPAAATLAGKAASPVKNVIANRLSSPTKKAERILQKDLARDRLTPARVEKAMRGMGDDARLADIGGSNTFGLADQIAQQPGPGQNIARRAVSIRDRAQGDRVSTALSDALGQPKGYYDDIDRLISERSKAARPIYERAVRPDNLVPDELFGKVVDDDFMQGVIKSVKSDPLYKMGALPDNSMPVIDAAKKRIDDMIETAKRAGENNRVRLLTDRKNQLVSVADDAFPEYSQARAAFEAPSRSIDALENGAKFIKQPQQLTSKQIQNMADGDKEFFRLGAARAIQDKIEAAADGADVVKRIFGNKAAREKLQAVFPDKDSFRKFEKAMRNESRMYRTKSITGNSATQRRQAKARDMGVDPGIATDMMMGNVGSATTSGLRGMLGSLMNPMDDKTSAELSRMLFSNDRQTTKALLDRLSTQGMPPEVSQRLGLLGQTGVLVGAEQGGKYAGLLN